MAIGIINTLFFP